MPPLDDEHISTWVVMIIVGLIVLMCLGILVLILVAT